MPGKMHADEIPTDAGLVRRLLREQYPRWADLTIVPVESSGTDNAIYRLGGEVDVGKAAAVWDRALRASVWSHAPRWIHGDLLPGNLLFRDGRLCAVIDFGALGVGDPACDVMAAWTCLTPETRKVFRAALDVDDATWARGRGWALSVGLIALPYYKDTTRDWRPWPATRSRRHSPTRKDWPEPLDRPRVARKTGRQDPWHALCVTKTSRRLRRPRWTKG